MDKKVVLIVMDSVGIGALPDAGMFGDEGSDTLGHILKAVPALALPNLESLGLFRIEGTSFARRSAAPLGCYGKAMERFPGKDTTGGHWEIAGLILDKPFPTFPNGFPKDLIAAFESAIGRGVLGNVAASGTEIIVDLGQEHMRSGKPIVYTSADSVFQIAAHEDVIPIDELYRICRVARRLLDGDARVGRVIARPFIGQPGSFVRTGNRRDFSVDPPGETLLDRLYANKLEVCGVGKIEDIFAHRGLTRSDHRSDNPGSIEATIAYQNEPLTGLIFTNLVDFDSLFGHRNNPKGYADALASFDAALPRIIGALGEEDLLILTADHGCDPTTASTDHSREYVPVLCCGKQFKKNVNLGIRETFADIGATVAAFFGLPPLKVGTSFLHEIEEDKTCH
jgi:phosphopentomutase